jgi:uncharacterized membrane protein (DUF2068 family)
MAKSRHKQSVSSGLHVVALFEGAKGALVLLTGFGLLALIHHDVHHAAERLVRHIHLNPARHYPMIFIEAAARVTDAQLWAYAFAALLYSVVRFAEAFGLWTKRRWAEWFGLVSGGMYIPIELYEVMQKPNWPRVTVLIVNTGVVAYLLRVVLQSNGR